VRDGNGKDEIACGKCRKCERAVRPTDLAQSLLTKRSRREDRPRRFSERWWGVLTESRSRDEQAARAHKLGYVPATHDTCTAAHRRANRCAADADRMTQAAAFCTNPFSANQHGPITETLVTRSVGEIVGSPRLAPCSFAQTW
jgi:hypothetical protein